MPEADPHIHATTYIPLAHPIPSTAGLLPPARNGSTLDLRLSPQQNCRQYKEGAKQSLEIPGRHGQRERAPSIGPKKNSQRAQYPCSQINLALLPVFAQRTQSNGRQQNKQRSALPLLHQPSVLLGLTEKQGRRRSRIPENAISLTPRRPGQDHEE